MGVSKASKTQLFVQNSSYFENCLTELQYFENNYLAIFVCLWKNQLASSPLDQVISTFFWERHFYLRLLTVSTLRGVCLSPYLEDSKNKNLLKAAL